MVDLAANGGLPHDLEKFVDGLEDGVALVANVRDVHPVVLGSGAGQGDELCGGGKGRRDVGQGRAQTDGSLSHGLAHQLPHVLELLGRGIAIFVPHLVHSNRGGSHERGHVAGDALVLEELEVLAQGGPLDVVVDVLLTLQALLFHLLVERPHGIAFTHHLQGHTLTNIAERASVLDERLVGPAEHVDEAGSHGHSGGVDLGGGSTSAEVAHGHDPIVIDRQIAGDWPAATAVV